MKNTPIKFPSSSFSTPKQRRGMTLVICLFVMSIVSVSLVGMMGSLTSQMAARRNTADYERSLYLAGAGVHHALAELEADSAWRTGISATPANSSVYYTASVADNGDNTLTVTGIGVASGVTRRLQVTVSTGS